MVSARLVRLPRGGRVIRVTVKSELTRFDVLAAAIEARRQGDELTRASIRLNLRRVMEERGVEGFMDILTNSTDQEQEDAEEAVSSLFPKL